MIEITTLFSHINLSSVTIFSGISPTFSDITSDFSKNLSVRKGWRKYSDRGQRLRCFSLLFLFPSYGVLYFLTVPRGCFTPMIHIPSFTLLLFFFLSLFFFLLPSSLFLSSILFLFSIFLQIFGAATAAMLHRFRRACCTQY